MMTGYGYNANLVQQPPVLQGVNEEWGQTGEQAQFYQVSGTTELSNPPFYGSSGWYQAPCCNFAEGAAASSQPSGLAPPTSNPFHLMHPTLAPPPPPQPRVSISDEELYQALNMSPLPHTSSGYMHLQNHPQTTDLSYLSSEVCFPSTSSSGYHDQVGFMPSTSAGLPEDPRHVLGNDGDDEESFEEPERFETMSPTFSIHSFAPTTSTNTAEAEDLEVELINNSKAPPKYQLIEDIDLFMRATTEETEYSDDDDSRPTTTYSHRSQKAQTPPATRPAYAQKFTAAAQHLQKPNTSAVIPIPDATKTTPLFLQTSLQEPAGFTPLLTPNSDALLQKKLSEVSHQPVHRGVAAFPAFPQQPESSYLDKETPFSDSYTPEATEGFYPLTGLNPIYDYNYQQSEQDILPLLLDTFKPLPPTQIPSAPVVVPIVVPELLTSSKKVSSSSKPPAAPIKAPRLSDQELECESQKLAIDVISNLFTSKKEIVDRAAVINAPKKPIARNLFCNDQESLVKAKSDDPINMNVLDDWETADDDDLAGRMENLLKDVKKSEQKKLPKPTFTPASHKNPDWDPNFLQHVLEIYGVPDYKMQEDVVKAMETIDYGDCKVSWMERKMVFAVFDSVARAKNCLTLAKHDWLRFRALADSPKAVQDFAVKSASSLTMPKKKQQTTATVARRMVENALGKKATVPAEKRQEERNQLAAARAAKKSTIQWD